MIGVTAAARLIMTFSMNATSDGLGRSGPAVYAENHSAMRWPVVFHGVFWLSLTAGLALSSFLFPPLQSPPYAALIACSLIAAMGGTWLLIINLPTGIRVDAAGIQIGGIRRAGRRRRARAGRLLPASAQRRAVFFCPWDDLHLAQVVTDRSELRRLSKLARGGPITRLGLLWSPFTRAALVMRVNPYAVSAPEFRPPDPHRYWFKVARMRTYAVYSVWLAPTRHPDALRAALAEHQLPGPATSGWDFTGYSGDVQYPSGYGEPTRGRRVVLPLKVVLFVAASAFLAGLIVATLSSPVTGSGHGGLWGTATITRCDQDGDPPSCYGDFLSDTGAIVLNDVRVYGADGYAVGTDVRAVADLKDRIVTHPGTQNLLYTVIGFTFVGGCWLRSVTWVFPPLWRRLRDNGWRLGRTARAPWQARRSG